MLAASQAGFKTRVLFMEAVTGSTCSSQKSQNSKAREAESPQNSPLGRLWETAQAPEGEARDTAADGKVVWPRQDAKGGQPCLLPMPASGHPGPAVSVNWFLEGAGLAHVYELAQGMNMVSTVV